MRVCAACVPAALGVTGDVVFQAVLLDLQRVVEGPIQLLHRHFDRALQAKKHRIILGNGNSVTLLDFLYPFKSCILVLE